MITRVAKAWDCITPVATGGRRTGGGSCCRKEPPCKSLLDLFSRGRGAMPSTAGRSRRGSSRGYAYGRIEDAHYARNVEIRIVVPEAYVIHAQTPDGSKIVNGNQPRSDTGCHRADRQLIAAVWQHHSQVTPLRDALRFAIWRAPSRGCPKSNDP